MNCSLLVLLDYVFRSHLALVWFVSCAASKYVRMIGANGTLGVCGPELVTGRAKHKRNKSVLRTIHWGYYPETSFPHLLFNLTSR